MQGSENKQVWTFWGQLSRNWVLRSRSLLRNLDFGFFRYGSLGVGEPAHQAGHDGHKGSVGGVLVASCGAGLGLVHWLSRRPSLQYQFSCRSYLLGVCLQRPCSDFAGSCHRCQTPRRKPEHNAGHDIPTRRGGGRPTPMPSGSSYVTIWEL